MTTSSDKNDPLDDFFMQSALWSGGIGREWEGDALLSGEFYAELIDLLYQYVPPARLQRLMKDWTAQP